MNPVIWNGGWSICCQLHHLSGQLSLQSGLIKCFASKQSHCADLTRLGFRALHAVDVPVPFCRCMCCWDISYNQHRQALRLLVVSLAEALVKILSFLLQAADGTELARDFTFISDAVEAVVAAMDTAGLSVRSQALYR